MIEYILGSSNIVKALFLMAAGIAGVFSVLILFFFMIKLLLKIFPEKGNNN